MSDHEAHGRDITRLKQRMHLPVFLWHEGANFALTLDDETHRDGLHTPRRQPPCHLRPQERTHLETHHPIQEAARLLRLHSSSVQLSRSVERLFDGFLGDFIKNDAVVTAGISANRLL